MKDNLILSPYQNYLHLIGLLKDAYKFTVDVAHRDIHTFIKDKKHIFKLLFGEDKDVGIPSIVISFHIDVPSHEALEWFLKIKKQFDPIKFAPYYVEDDVGETYLGSDALKIKNIITTQEVLAKWLETKNEEDMQEFIRSDVVGRAENHRRVYDSRNEFELAKIEFDRLRRPTDEEDYQ